MGERMFVTKKQKDMFGDWQGAPTPDGTIASDVLPICRASAVRLFPSHRCSWTVCRELGLMDWDELLATTRKNITPRARKILDKAVRDTPRDPDYMTG